jgi:hypothetical protein
VPFRDAYHQVRDHLHDLRGMDPDVALARKTHLGAPAGLDFTIYTDAISNARDALRKNRRTIDSALAKLLPSRPLPQ